MKRKLLLFLFLWAVGWQAWGQFKIGDAVTTKSGLNIPGQSVEIYPVGNTTYGGGGVPPADPGDNWGMNSTHIQGSPDWNAMNLGQVFGIAINTSMGGQINPPIYVSVTQMYPPIPVGIFPAQTYQGGLWSDYLTGINHDPMTQVPNGTPVQSSQGATLIWQLNPGLTGPASYTSLVKATHTDTWPPPNPNEIYNRGTGIGNICYDRTHNQLFATNFEDGRIYRIDVTPGPTYGHVLSRYDPFATFTCSSCSPTSPQFEILGERLWGIAYNERDDRLYFSVWGEDYGNIDGNPSITDINRQENNIWSVPINPATTGLYAGEFFPMETTLGNDWTDNGATTSPQMDAKPMFLWPIRPPLSEGNDVTPIYSNPVSDIEFNQGGTVMLVCEKSIGRYGPTPPTYHMGSDGSLYALFDLGWSHRSRLLSFTWNQTIPPCSTMNQSGCGALVCGAMPVLNGWSPTRLQQPMQQQGDCNVLRYQNQYYVGNLHARQGHIVDAGSTHTLEKSFEYWGDNTCGGADFGYERVTPLPQLCEEFVYATGDALENETEDPNQDNECYEGFPGGNSLNCSPLSQGGETIYGFAGIPRTGNDYFLCCNRASNRVQESGLYQTMFGNTTLTATSSKDYAGDIDIYRGECCQAQAILTVDLEDDEDPCIGEEITFTLSGNGPGAVYGILTDVNGNEICRGPLSPPLTCTWTPTLANLGGLNFCLIVYDSEPLTEEEEDDYCAPPACVFIDPMICNCDDLGVDINHIAPVGTTYTFFNDFIPPFTDPVTGLNDLNPTGGTGTINPLPAWITWSVDGVEMQTTFGTDPFTHQFTEGNHVICMEVAFIVEDEDGEILCCYKDDCEVIHIAGCEYWKAITNVVPKILDPNQPQIVAFDYQGHLGDAIWELTVLWDFGDGSPVVISQAPNPDVTHTYTTPGPHPWRAIVVWSIGPWDGSHSESCCCIEEITGSVLANNCGPIQYDFTLATDPPPARFVVTGLTPSYTWVWRADVSPTSTLLGTMPDLIYGGQPKVCLHATYNSTPPCPLTPVCHEIGPGGTILGVDETNTPVTLMRYYPNPTEGVLTVELEIKQPGEASIEIMDYLGRSVQSNTFKNLARGLNQFNLNIGEFASGIYQMRVSVGKDSKVVKVVKY